MSIVRNSVSKVLGLALTTLLAAGVVSFAVPAGEAHAANVKFSDKALHACMNADLKKSLNQKWRTSTSAISTTDAAKLKNAYCVKKGVTSLNGMQYFKGLTYADFSGNKISNLTPLSGLTNLTNINLVSNKINNLNPLKKLTKLKTLSLRANNVLDLRPLNSLKALTNVDVSAQTHRGTVTAPAGSTMALTRAYTPQGAVQSYSGYNTKTGIYTVPLGVNAKGVNVGFFKHVTVNKNKKVNHSVTMINKLIITKGTFKGVSPKVTGNLAAGSTLTVTHAKPANAQINMTYSWFAGKDGKQFIANGKSVKLSTGYVGQTIYVEVKQSPVVSGAATPKIERIKVGVLKPAARTGTFTIGATHNGKAITALPYSQPVYFTAAFKGKPMGKVTIDVLVDGKVFRSGFSYDGPAQALVYFNDAEAGKKVTIRATSTQQGYATVTSTKEFGTAPQRPVATYNPSVKINYGAATKTAKAGDTLIAVPGANSTFAKKQSKVDFEWRINNSTVASRTAAYTVKRADVGKTLSLVTISYGHPLAQKVEEVQLGKVGAVPTHLTIRDAAFPLNVNSAKTATVGQTITFKSTAKAYKCETIKVEGKQDCTPVANAVTTTSKGWVRNNVGYAGATSPVGTAKATTYKVATADKGKGLTYVTEYRIAGSDTPIQMGYGPVKVQ